jgi:hypothetical protein
MTTTDTPSSTEERTQRGIEIRGDRAGRTRPGNHQDLIGKEATAESNWRRG